MGGFTLPPFPQLLPVELTTPIVLDPPPTYTDVFLAYFADDVALDFLLDPDIAEEALLMVEFGVELALGDADVAALDALSAADDAPYDTSGLDAVDAAFGGVQAKGQAVCVQLGQVLIQTGITPTGNCDAAPSTGTGGGGTGGGTPTPGQPTASPYPVNPLPGPDGQPMCADSDFGPEAQFPLPDAVVGQAPIVFVFSAANFPPGFPAFKQRVGADTGPTDIIFTFDGEQYQTSPWYDQTVICVIYPARTGAFNWTIAFALDDTYSNIARACLSLHVNPAPSATPLPAATPSAPSDLLATVAGAATAPSVIDLGTFTLGSDPSPTYSPNNQWATAKSALYGDGEVVGGPADMLVTSGNAHDPASVNAYIQYMLIVLPIRVGTWAWLVKFYEDGAQTIPFYICFTATVTAPSS